MNEVTTVGFIGLGQMGFPMARRLCHAGYSPHVFDVRPEAMAALEAYGARPMASPCEVGSSAQVVLVSLPTPAVVREVALGTDGLLGSGTMTTYIDLSTTGPAVAHEVGAAMASRGVAVLDAPVSGGVPGAEKGTLSLMVAGSKEVLENRRSILEVLGKVFYVGSDVGQGQTVKVLNNLLSGTALAITAEAVVLGVKAGLSPSVLIDVFNASTGRNSATEDKFPKAVVNRTFNYGFKAGLLYKDLKLCMDQAEVHGVPMWVGSAVRQMWEFVVSQGGPNQDFTEIVKYVEQWAGTTVVD